MSQFLPNDTYAIYQVPTNYTFTVECEHDIATDMGIRLVFPETFYIFEDNSCTLGDIEELDFTLASGYSCTASNEYNNITFYNFASQTITGGTEFTFSLDSIRNPG